MFLTQAQIDELTDAVPRAQAELRAIAAYKAELRKRAEAHKQGQAERLSIQYREGRAQMETATKAWGDLSKAFSAGRVGAAEGAKKLERLRNAFTAGKELAAHATQQVAEIRDVEPIQVWETHTRSMFERLGPNVVRSLPQPPACLFSGAEAPRAQQS